MGLIEYNLYRVKFIEPFQIAFYNKKISPSEIFLKAIGEKPFVESRRGSRWHIANIRLFTSYTGFFAIGRTTKGTIGKLDEESGDFIEEELETSPYTYCAFNSQISILGIARKSNLSTTTVASKIQKLLSLTDVVENNEISVEILPIYDPEGFIHIINTAYKVIKFTATFKRRNPFDADEYFQQPLSVYLTAAGGKDHGNRMKIEGKSKRLSRGLGAD